MIRVGILRGGANDKYAMSLAAGAYILKHLPRDRYEPVDILVDREGVWHIGGVPASYERLAQRVDIIWNALYGFYGEDGKVQQLLENLGIPYTGAGPLSSAIAMHKRLSKDQMHDAGMPTPRGIYIENWGEGFREEAVAEAAASVSQQFSPPWIIQPVSRGVPGGEILAKTRNDLMSMLGELFDVKAPLLIEEAVLGREASIIVVPGFRGRKIYLFLPDEKGKPGARMRAGETERMEKIASAVHEKLRLGQYSRVRIAITPRGHMYVLGAETMLPFHEPEEVERALASVGSSFDELADHILVQALGKTKTARSL